MVEKAKSRGNADAYRGSSTHYTAKILVLGELSLRERSVVRGAFFVLSNRQIVVLNGRFTANDRRERFIRRQLQHLCQRLCVVLHSRFLLSSVPPRRR